MIASASVAGVAPIALLSVFSARAGVISPLVLPTALLGFVAPAGLLSELISPLLALRLLSSVPSTHLAVA